MKRGAVAMLALAAMWLAVTSSSASAHFATIAYSNVVVESDGAVRWDLHLDPYHLAGLLPLDRDENGYVTAEEVTASRTDLADLARESVAVSRAGAALSARVGEVALVEAGPLALPEPWRPPDDFPLVHIEVRFDSGSGGDTTLAYRLFERAGVDDHQNIAVATTGDTEYLHVFDPDAATLTLASPAPGVQTTSLLLAVAGGAVAGGLVVAAQWKRRRPNAP